jgi:hypothetical protein
MFAARGCASATVDSRGLPIDSALMVRGPASSPLTIRGRPIDRLRDGLLTPPHPAAGNQ